MEILRTLWLYVEGKDLPFLLIGGHAVNAYGISRQTGDIDLVVQRSRKEGWLELMRKLRYEKGQDNDNFARFSPDSIAAWPIDLMFVDDPTFSNLSAESTETFFGPARVRIVSARHLATMKIHALKIYQEHRFARDYSDLISLLRSGKTRISEPELRELCQRYADGALYERLLKDWRQK